MKYLVRSIHRDALEEDLNEYSDLGWRPISITSSSGQYYVVVFEKELKK